MGICYIDCFSITRSIADCSLLTAGASLVDSCSGSSRYRNDFKMWVYKMGRFTVWESIKQWSSTWWPAGPIHQNINEFIKREEEKNQGCQLSRTDCDTNTSHTFHMLSRQTFFHAVKNLEKGFLKSATQSTAGPHGKSIQTPAIAQQSTGGSMDHIRLAEY